MSQLSDKTYKVNINFRQIGLNKLDGELAKIQTELPHIQNALKSIGADNSLTRTFENSFAQLEENIAAVERLKKVINALSSDNPKAQAGAASQFGITDPNNSEAIYLALAEKMDVIAKKVLQTKSNFKALEQASLNYFSALKTSTKEYISTLKKLGLEEKTISKLSLKQKQLFESAKKLGDTKSLKAYNTSLKTRVLLLGKLQQKQHYLGSTSLPKSISGTMTKQIEQLKNSLNNLSIPLETIQTKFAGLIPDSYIKKAEKTRTINAAFIKTFRKLGIASTVLVKMRTNMDALLKTYIKTGNATQLDGYISSLKIRESILRETKVLQDKVNASLATELEKEQALKNIRSATSAAQNVGASKQDLADKYNAAKDAVNNLDQALRQQAKLEKESLQTLQRYEQELASLERLKQIKSLWATPRSKKEAAEAIKDIKIMIAKVQEYRKTLNSASGQASVATPKGFKESEASLSKLKGSLTGIVEKAREAKASLSNMGLVQVAKRTAAYASAYAGFYQVIQAFRNGIGFVVEFDKNVHVMAAVFDVAITKARQLQKGLVDLGRTYGGDIKNINEAALALGRAGLAASDVVKATEIVIKMAKLTGDTIGVSSNALITYKQDFEDAAHPISVLGDQLAYVANQSRLSTQDIGTFSNYALASAKAAGLSVEAINAMAISLSNAGVNASTIGTEIRRFSFLLRDSSSSVQKFFTSLGTSQQTLAARIRYSTDSANKALLELITKSAAMSDAAFAKSLQGMDIRAAEILTLLRNNSESFKAHFKDLLDGVNGELDKSNYIADSYASTWERVKNSLGSVFEALSRSGFQTVNGQLQTFNDMLIKISNNSDKFMQNILHYFKMIGYALSGLFAFKGIVSLWEAAAVPLKNIKTSLIIVEGAMARSKTIMSGLFSIIKKIAIVVASFFIDNPIVLAIAAIGAATYFAYTSLNKTDKVMAHLTQTQKTLNTQIRLGSDLHKEKLYKAQQELSLSKAIKNGNQAEINNIIEAIALTDVRITKLLTQKNIVDKTVTAIERQNTLLALQSKIKILGKEKSILLDINTTEAKNRIKQINTELSKIHKTVVIKVAIANKINAKTTLANVITEMNNIKNNLNMPTKVKNNILRMMNLQLVAAEKHLTEVNKKISKVKKTGGIQGLFTISSKDIQNFTHLTRTIKTLYKSGENVDVLKGTAKQTLEHSIKGYTHTVQSVLTKALGDLKVNTGVLDTLPKNVKDTLNTIVKESKHLDTTKGVANFNASLENMTILLKNTKTNDPKALNILTTIIENAQKGSSNLQQLLALYKELSAVGKLDQSKLKFTPFDQTASSKTAMASINKAYATLLQKQKQLTNLTADRTTHLNKVALIESKLVQNEKTQNASVKVYLDLLKKRKQIVIELKKLDGTGTLDAQKEKTKELNTINKEINNTERQIFNTEKDRLNLAGSLVSAKIKEAEAIKKVNAETQSIRDKTSSTVANPFVTHSLQVKKELNYDPSNSLPGDEKKADAYFSNMGAYLDKKKQDLYNKKYSTEGAVAPGQSMAAYDQIRTDATQTAKAQETDKLTYLKDQQQVLQEQQQAGYITMSEMHSAYNALELEKTKAHADATNQIYKTRFNATIGLYGGAAATLAGTLDNLQKSGLIKSKSAFRAMQALQIVSAISSTYLAVTQALANPPGPPWSYVMAAGALATGMANVAQIKAQKFHTGGYVSGQQSGSMGGLRDDEIPAILKKNEYVLTQNDIKGIKSGNNTSAQVPQQAPIKNETVIINSIDPSVIDEWATSRAGREVIRNVVNA